MTIDDRAVRKETPERPAVRVSAGCVLCRGVAMDPSDPLISSLVHRLLPPTANGDVVQARFTGTVRADSRKPHGWGTLELLRFDTANRLDATASLTAVSWMEGQPLGRVTERLSTFDTVTGAVVNTLIREHLFSDVGCDVLQESIELVSRDNSGPPSRQATTPRPPSRQATTPRPPSRQATTPRPPSRQATTPRPPSRQVTTPRPPSRQVTTPRPPSRLVDSAAGRALLCERSRRAASTAALLLRKDSDPTRRNSQPNNNVTLLCKGAGSNTTTAAIEALRGLQRQNDGGDSVQCERSRVTAAATASIRLCDAARIAQSLATHIASTRRAPPPRSTSTWKDADGAIISAMNEAAMPLPAPPPRCRSYYRIGEWVSAMIQRRTIHGVVAFCGPSASCRRSEERRHPLLVGIVADAPHPGFHNGTINGHTYFHCDDQRGVLVPVSRVASDCSDSARPFERL